ncbi:MAG: phosphoribosylanthranilate isomerase, partial [Prevotellaceae bacterium]|nr:phosphoribosylanthranilate isomerase [Prevotellaceae bacterium]
MRVKVCGMRRADNIAAICELPIDFIGFIFYPASPRFCAGVSLREAAKNIPPHIRKVGVFVNESAENIVQVQRDYSLEMLQLHGSESPAMCRDLRTATRCEIIKAFAIATADDFAQTKSYAGFADYFLFDTKTEKHGGSGQKFDWQTLGSYCGDTPFFLSGGIRLDDAETLKTLAHPRLYAADLNSGLEVE